MIAPMMPSVTPKRNTVLSVGAGTLAEGRRRARARTLTPDKSAVAWFRAYSFSLFFIIARSGTEGSQPAVLRARAPEPGPLLSGWAVHCWAQEASVPERRELRRRQFCAGGVEEGDL
jgi:hypothetical protein